MALDTTALDIATRKHFLPVTKNNLYNKTRLFNVLNKAGRVQPWHGTALDWAVVYQKHASVGLFSGYSPLANQPINPLLNASLASAHYYATIAISKEEEMKNQGKMEKLLDLLKVQMKNAESTLRDQMATDFYGSGATVGGLQPIIGLQGFVSASATYAGISQSTYSFWQSNAVATAYTVANLEDATHAGYLPRLLYTALTNATHDDSPDLVVTTKTIYNIYKLIAQTTNLRIDNRRADLGFEAVAVDGITIMFDDFCTPNYLYALTTGDITVFVFDGANFDFDESETGTMWKKPTNQLAKLAHLIWMGQFRCDAPRQQAVYSNLAAT